MCQNTGRFYLPMAMHTPAPGAMKISIPRHKSVKAALRVAGRPQDTPRHNNGTGVIIAPCFRQVAEVCSLHTRANLEASRSKMNVIQSVTRSQAPSLWGASSRVAGPRRSPNGDSQLAANPGRSIRAHAAANKIGVHALVFAGALAPRYTACTLQAMQLLP